MKELSEYLKYTVELGNVNITQALLDGLRASIGNNDYPIEIFCKAQIGARVGSQVQLGNQKILTTGN